MARRTEPARPVGTTVVDEAYLRWRFLWLVRAHLLAHHYPAVGREASRLRGLPIARQVAELEDFLAGRSWLARSERLVNSLASRARR